MTLYLQNLIRQLTKEKNIEVTFLSSGSSYDLLQRKIYWKRTTNIYENKNVNSYEIVNSPIKAPAHDSFGQIEDCSNNDKIANAFVDFVKHAGPYEIIHFHNIEGISVKCIEALKKNLESKIVYTFHNYHLLCPQIELFRYGKELCHDYEEGAACVGCLEVIPNSNVKKIGQGFAGLIERVGLSGKPLGDALFGSAANCRKLAKTAKTHLMRQQKTVRGNDKGSALDYKTLTKLQTNEIKKLSDIQVLYRIWREKNIETVNNLIDCVVAVSNQVKERIVALGVNEQNVRVVHNGMDIYRKKDERVALYHRKNNKGVHVAFFGYPIPSKGLDFFIEGLLQIQNPEFIDKAKIHIVSQLNDQIRRKLIRLIHRGYDLSILQGYHRSVIAELMKDIDLGVIPSLWWETYNQVGYEMVMHGVPVLISDTVGIKDFFDNKELFLFKSGDKDDFSKKIVPLVINKEQRSAFWRQSLDLPSMETHTSHIIKIYQNLISNVL